MGWLKRLHEDSSLLISASSQAQRAYDYIVGDQYADETSSVSIQPETSSNVIIV